MIWYVGMKGLVSGIQKNNNNKSSAVVSRAEAKETKQDKEENSS